MQRYTDYVTNQNGVPVVGASILVLQNGTLIPATLFSDKTGSTPLANPVSSDTLGGFWFYAADGRYDLQVSGSSISTLYINDVLLEDPLDGSAAVFSSVAITGLSGPVRANGSSNLTVAQAGDVDYLVPTQAGNSGKALFTNGTGTYWGAVAGGGTVTSVAGSGGTTGLTFSGGPVIASGTLTLGGTLAVANGGTGQTAYSNGQLLIGNASGGLTKTTITAGSGVTVTNGDGSITIGVSGGTGTVTSVNASGGTTGMSFTGGPVTSSGTLALTGTLAVANGGTGGATQALARTGLDVYSKAEVDALVTSSPMAMALILG